MKIANEVLAVLSAAETAGNELRLVGQLDRKMYVKVNDILGAAGGKWNRKSKAHIFDGDAADRIDEIILTGEVEKPKDEFNFFPTPPEVVEMIVKRADAQHGMNILEPSAGRGNIAHAFPDAIVDCVELMKSNAEYLIALGEFHEVLNLDFLTVVPEPKYDRVVMNPPFMKQLDIKHVMHAHRFIKDNGILVAIMSASVIFRTNKLTEEFRNFVSDKGGIIEDLPNASFKKAGTMVNTVIVTIPA